MLPEGEALAELLAEGPALPEPDVVAPGGAVAVSAALVQAPSTRQSAEVTAAAAALPCRRLRPPAVGLGVLFVVPLVLTCSFAPRSAVLGSPRYVGPL